VEERRRRRATEQQWLAAVVARIATASLTQLFGQIDMYVL